MTYRSSDTIMRCKIVEMAINRAAKSLERHMNGMVLKLLQASTRGITTREVNKSDTARNTKHKLVMVRR